ncbi:hypothetical protein L209DRAFT_685546 [Thermothelomyces heterothallicus CBS 203.75]
MTAPGDTATVGRPGERDTQPLPAETRSTGTGNAGLRTAIPSSPNSQRRGVGSAPEAQEHDDRAVSVTGLSNYSVDLSVDHDDDGEDAFASGSITESSTSSASVSSSVYEFVEENGRTYHKYKEGSKHIRSEYRLDTILGCVIG